MSIEAVDTKVTFINVSAAPFLLVIFSEFVPAGVCLLVQIRNSEQKEGQNVGREDKENN